MSSHPTIWVDGDGCPRRIRRIVLRAGVRRGLPVVLVADRDLGEEGGGLVRLIRVDRKDQGVDGYIRSAAVPGDLVVTADIPLAAGLVEDGLRVIHPRGDLFDRGNVRERLSIRDFMAGLRRGGLDTRSPRRGAGGGDPGRRFAAALERALGS